MLKAIMPAAVCLLCLSLLLGCSGTRRPVPVEEKRSDTSMEKISPRGYNHFVNATTLELFGYTEDALKEYARALVYFPDSPTIRTDYARLLFRSHRIPEALEQARKIEPKTSDVHLLLGDCYRLTGQNDMAMFHYREAVALDTENINAYWYLAGYYREHAKPDSAIEMYYELARLSDSYRIYQELGTLLGQNRRYEEALDAFRRAIVLDADNDNVTAWLGLAATYDAMDSLAAAERALDEAVKIDKYDVRIFRQMLAMYLDRQDLAKSIEASEKLVSLVPSDWVAQRRLGVLLYSDGQLDRSDSLFAERIEFGDDNVLNLFYRGRIAFEQGRLDDALDWFRTVTSEEPVFIDGWLNLGFVYRELDRIDTSIDILMQGVDVAVETEDKTRMLFALGAAQERGDRFHDAVETFKTLIEIDSAHAPALNYLGYMLADNDQQLSYALELIERAIALAPDNGAYIDSYGWVHFKLGNYQEALAELQRAAELIDTDAVIFEHLGDVHNALGNDIEAEKYYRRALEINPDSLDIEEKLKD